MLVRKMFGRGYHTPKRRHPSSIQKDREKDDNGGQKSGYRLVLKIGAIERAPEEEEVATVNMKKKPRMILGQKASVIAAVVQNIISWLVKLVAPSYLPRLLPTCAHEDTSIASNNNNAHRTRCISIGRPGGVEQLRVITLQEGIVTCGYNVKGQEVPFTKPIRSDKDVPADCIVLRNEAFSVNYADCCIRCAKLICISL